MVIVIYPKSNVCLLYRFNIIHCFQNNVSMLIFPILFNLSCIIKMYLTFVILIFKTLYTFIYFRLFVPLFFVNIMLYLKFKILLYFSFLR